MSILRTAKGTDGGRRNHGFAHQARHVMDVTIEALVLALFRHIVAQSTAALRSEGERSLRRIEPLCRRKGEDFGAASAEGLMHDSECEKCFVV